MFEESRRAAAEARRRRRERMDKFLREAADWEIYLMAFILLAVLAWVLWLFRDW